MQTISQSIVTNPVEGKADQIGPYSVEAQSMLKLFMAGIMPGIMAGVIFIYSSTVIINFISWVVMKSQNLWVKA